MRIGMILDDVFPPDPRVENEAISLLNNGHKVFLFCLKYGSESTSEVINKIQVRRYPSNTIAYKLSALAYTIPLYSFLMKLKITKFIQACQIEVLHIHDMRIAQAVFNANRKFHLPVVLDLHENRPAIMKYYPHLQKAPGKYLISPKIWQIKEEKFIKKADKIVVVTSQSKMEILSRVSIDKRKITVLPNTIRKSFYENAIIQPQIIKQYFNHFSLLYIGDTGSRRGLITAIKSIKKLKSKIENIKLVIVGKMPKNSILLKLVEDLDLNSFVDFLGWKDPSQFSSYISSCDICISPLHRNLHHDTTYANKLFQYMSFGKPLLVSDAIAQKELVENTNSGIVHKEKNVSDFTEKVLELYRNKTLRTTLGKNGERFVKEEFSWEKTSKDLIDMYKTISN